MSWGMKDCSISQNLFSCVGLLPSDLRDNEVALGPWVKWLGWQVAAHQCPLMCWSERDICMVEGQRRTGQRHSGCHSQWVLAPRSCHQRPHPDLLEGLSHSSLGLKCWWALPSASACFWCSCLWPAARLFVTQWSLGVMPTFGRLWFYSLPTLVFLRLFTVAVLRALLTEAGQLGCIGRSWSLKEQWLVSWAEVSSLLV